MGSPAMDRISEGRLHTELKEQLSLHTDKAEDVPVVLGSYTDQHFHQQQGPSNNSAYQICEKHPARGVAAWRIFPVKNRS